MCGTWGYPGVSEVSCSHLITIVITIVIASELPIEMVLSMCLVRFSQSGRSSSNLKVHVLETRVLRMAVGPLIDTAKFEVRQRWAAIATWIFTK
jgi:hypothetical protein